MSPPEPVFLAIHGGAHVFDGSAEMGSLRLERKLGTLHVSRVRVRLDSSRSVRRARSYVEAAGA